MHVSGMFEGFAAASLGADLLVGLDAAGNER